MVLSSFREYNHIIIIIIIIIVIVISQVVVVVNTNDVQFRVNKVLYF